MNILYEDADIIVCHKPAGIASQSDRSFLPDMVSQIRNYLASSQKNVRQIPYVGVVHRLDKPVEGILVYGKNKKATAALSKEIMAGGSITKLYEATVKGLLPVSDTPTTLTDYLLFDKQKNISTVVEKDTKDAKKAVLEYQVVHQDILKDGTKVTKLKIHLHTGRHHQIRVQLSHLGYPIVGDAKYGDPQLSHFPLMLCACALTFKHPTSGKTMHFQL